VNAAGVNTTFFIDCPFDSAYEPLFRAITFCVYDCGYIPRCALEDENGGEVRIERIYKLINESRFAIHDISRTELDSGSRLPRFNMPLELGMFLGARKFGCKKHRSKICLILDTERYRYQKFVSDIAGQDIRSHENEPEKAISAVRTWLAANTRAVAIPGAGAIFRRYRRFQLQLPVMCKELRWKVNEISHPDFEHLVSKWLKLNMAF